MSGLMSTLAVSTAIAASLTSGLTPLEAPSIDSQSPSITRENNSQSDANTYIDSATDLLLSSSGNSSVDESTISGVDISSHQHGGDKNLDIKTITSQGNQKFAFIKASEGTHYVNPNYRQDTIDFINTATPVGFYHYAKPSDDPENAREQARLFVSVTGINQGVKSLPPVLDIEENENNLSSGELIAWVDAFVDEIKKTTGKNTMIYTYPNFWRDQMGNTTNFSDLPLWIAHYNGGDKPGSLPGGWTNWTFWQYTDSGSVEGYNHKIDVNYFNGTESDLRSIYN